MKRAKTKFDINTFLKRQTPVKVNANSGGLVRQWHLPSKSQDADGQQVKCMNAVPGYQFLKDGTFDKFPAAVRKPVSKASFNMCPYCFRVEADRIANGRRPTITIYIETIAAIERVMGGGHE
jgi:hypothetical protein